MNNKGFTGLEVLLVVTIFLIPAIALRKSEAKRRALQEEILLRGETGKTWACIPESWTHSSGIGKCFNIAPQEPKP